MTTALVHSSPALRAGRFLCFKYSFWVETSAIYAVIRVRPTTVGQVGVPKRLSLALLCPFWEHLPYTAILLARRMATFSRSTRHDYIANSSFAGFMLDLHESQDITLNTTTKVHLKATGHLCFYSSPLFELYLLFQYTITFVIV